MSRHPIIILEGADATGKTTLAREIGGHYIHATYNKDLSGVMVEYHLGLLDAAVVLSEHSHVVIDRWRMSEIVYGNVFRDGPEQDHRTGKLYSRANDFGATFVCCHPTNKQDYIDHFNTVKKTRSEMFDSMIEVYDEYERQIKILERKFEVIRHDILDPFGDALPQDILATAILKNKET